MGFGFNWMKRSRRGNRVHPAATSSSSTIVIAASHGRTDLVGGDLLNVSGFPGAPAPEQYQNEEEGGAELGDASQITSRADIIREVIRGQLTSNEIAKRYELFRRAEEGDQHGQGEELDQRSPSRWKGIRMRVWRPIRYIWMCLLSRRQRQTTPPADTGRIPGTFFVDLPINARENPTGDLADFPRCVDPRAALKVNQWLDKTEPFWKSRRDREV